MNLSENSIKNEIKGTIDSSNEVEATYGSSNLLKLVGKLPRDVAYIALGYIPEVCKHVEVAHIKFPDCRIPKWHMTNEYQFVIIEHFDSRKKTIDVEIYNCNGKKVKVIIVSNVRTYFDLVISRHNYSDKSFHIRSRSTQGSFEWTSYPLTQDEWNELKIIPRLYPGLPIISEFEKKCIRDGSELAFMHAEYPLGWYCDAIGQDIYACGIRVHATFSEFYKVLRNL